MYPEARHSGVSTSGRSAKSGKIRAVPAESERLVSISEAAELTGLSAKALRGRVDRGSLASVKRGGRRLIHLSDLQRHGLVRSAVTERELLDRLERQAETIGELRARLAAAERHARTP